MIKSFQNLRIRFFKLLRGERGGACGASNDRNFVCESGKFSFTEPIK